MSVNNDLIDRILEGEVSDEEAAEFQAWLNVPENLESFALRAELHSDLRRSLRRRQIQKNAVEASTAGLVTEAVSSREQLALAIPRSRPLLALTVTALVTAACILIAFVLPEGNSDSVPADAYAAKVINNVIGSS